MEEELTMNALEKYAAKRKLAKILRVSDIEDEIGSYLSDPDEKRVRKLISKKMDKSFVLRHPWLTGIPTLGIAPAVAKGRATDSIVRRLARERANIRSAIEAKRNRQRQEYLEDRRLDIKSDRANQLHRAELAKGQWKMRALAAARSKEGKNKLASMLKEAKLTSP